MVVWGDGNGNCMDWFFVGVVYFDGECLSIVMCCGYYICVVFVVWDWCDGKLM